MTYGPPCTIILHVYSRTDFKRQNFKLRIFFNDFSNCHCGGLGALILTRDSNTLDPRGLLTVSPGIIGNCLTLGLTLERRINCFHCCYVFKVILHKSCKQILLIS